MNDEKWEDLLYKISLKAKLERSERTENDGRTRIETVIFDVGNGKMKLERITRPLILEKRTRYSKRIGGAVAEEYVYSETEKVYRVNLYRWSEEESDWVEVEFRRTLF